VVEHRSGEGAPEHRTCIEIEPVGKLLRHAGLERRVAMDHIEAVVARVGQEWLANPEHLISVLLLERNPRANTDVDEEAIVVREEQRQALEPGEMLVWNRVHARDLVAAQRHVAAVTEPKRLVAIAQGADQHVLVIAAQAGDLARLGFLQVDQQVDDLPAVAAAVDIVADKHELGATTAAMAPAMLQQADKLLVAAVDVTDRVDQWS